jgi:hypothetical protein
MPHDKNGKALQVGDAVIVRAVVAQVCESPDYCNVTLKTVEPMHPGDLRSSLVLNTRQVEKA